MINKFDELTKNMAQSVTRRAALKKFGLGLAGMALACFGIAPKAEAGGECNACLKGCEANGGSKKLCHDFCATACGGKPPRWP